MNGKWLYDVIFEANGDVEESSILMRNHQGELEAVIDEEAQKRAEELFTAKEEEHRLAVIKEIDAANVRAKAAEISGYPNVSSTVIINGKELTREDFIPSGIVRDPAYSGDRLIFIDDANCWQRLKSKGGRDYVSDFVVTVIVIVYYPWSAQCRAITVCLQGVDTPLIFDDGIIDAKSVKRQTAFCHKGLNSNGDLVFQSFIRAMKRCPNVYFLTTPDFPGGILSENGDYCYISALSMLPGLEKLYPVKIRQHQLLQHERGFAEIIDDYRANLPDFWQLKLAVTIRVMSILLPFYEAEGLKPDRFFVCSPTEERGKQAMIALINRFNYDEPVVTSVTCRITKVREMLTTGNDMTAIFTYNYCESNRRAFANALSEIYRTITNANGLDVMTRQIITLITDVPGAIPEEYPAYYLSLADTVGNVNLKALLKLSGELDYSIIQFLTNNRDAPKLLIHQAIQEAREMLSNAPGTEHSDMMTMIVATSTMLCKIGIISGDDQQAIFNWLGTEANAKATVAENVGERFKTAVSRSIISGELMIAKQFGPPYFSDDGKTIFIAEIDGSINFTEAVLQKVILPQIPVVGSIVQLNKYLIENQWLITSHTNKRQLKVVFESGVQDQKDMFSYCRKVMDTKAKAFVDDMIYNEFWFDIDTTPDGFVQVLRNDDGSKVAGYVLNDEMDINRHAALFGISRSGKTYATLQTALIRASHGETVLIFDQSGSYTENELEKHLGKDMVQKYVCRWEIFRDGLPVDLTSLQGCQAYREKKDRIVRMYALMARSLGTYEETILNHAVQCMLRDKANPQPNLSSITQYIRNDCNADGKRIVDDAHSKLLYKLDAVLDDFVDMQDSSDSWSKFVKRQDKPIIVISTGADSIGKGSSHVDMLLESLYIFKQQYPDDQYTVILDEVQDLYLHPKGAVNTLLRKVGKDSVSILLASQAFPEPNTSLGNVIGNCGRVRGYRPKATDVMLSAKYYGHESGEVDTLQQGECFDKGLFYSRYRGKNVITTLRGKTIVFSSSDES